MEAKVKDAIVLACRTTAKILRQAGEQGAAKEMDEALAVFLRESFPQAEASDSIRDAFADLAGLAERAHQSGKYALAVEYASSVARRALDYIASRPAESAKTCTGCTYDHPASAVRCWYPYAQGETCVRLSKDKIADRFKSAKEEGR